MSAHNTRVITQYLQYLYYNNKYNKTLCTLSRPRRERSINLAGNANKIIKGSYEDSKGGETIILGEKNRFYTAALTPTHEFMPVPRHLSATGLVPKELRPRVTYER